jgi:hypothetical protein
MTAIELGAGQSVRVGRYTLRIVAVRGAEVIVALFDPEKDCAGCGVRPASPSRCQACQTEAPLCADCLQVRFCPRCACSG